MRKLLYIALVLALAQTARAEDPPFHDGERAFQRARELLQKQFFDDKVSDDQLWRMATAGMLSGVGAGNKFDKLMSPSDLAALKADLAGEVVGLGIGMTLDEPSGIVNVDAVVPASAAERNGLKVGDKILKLDGKSLKGMTEEEVARSIRGKAGTAVTLTVLRDAEIFTRTIKRMPFILDPVSSMMLPGGVGLVQLRAFTDKTPALLKSALERLRQEGPKALVIDLRNNEGGLYARMLECAGELLPKGALVVTATHRGGATTETKTSTEPLMTLPMVVLINSSTASGAEILAGALKHAGARVIGKRTYGKWNAQNLEELGNGWAVKFTFLEFRPATGPLPVGHGLDPDLEVEMDTREVSRVAAIKDGAKRLAADAQLRAGVSLLKLSR